MTVEPLAEEAHTQWWMLCGASDAARNTRYRLVTACKDPIQARFVRIEDGVVVWADDVRQATVLDVEVDYEMSDHAKAVALMTFGVSVRAECAQEYGEEKETTGNAAEKPKDKEAAENAANEAAARKSTQKAVSSTAGAAPAEFDLAEGTAEEVAEAEIPITGAAGAAKIEFADRAAKQAVAKEVAEEAANEATEVAREPAAAAQRDAEKKASAMASNAEDEVMTVAANGIANPTLEEEPAQDAGRSSGSVEPDPVASLGMCPAPQAQATRPRKRDSFKRGLNRVCGGRAMQCFRRPHVEPVSAPPRTI